MSKFDVTVGNNSYRVAVSKKSNQIVRQLPVSALPNGFTMPPPPPLPQSSSNVPLLQSTALPNGFIMPPPPPRTPSMNAPESEYINVPRGQVQLPAGKKYGTNSGVTPSAATQDSVVGTETAQRVAELNARNKLGRKNIQTFGMGGGRRSKTRAKSRSKLRNTRRR